MFKNIFYIKKKIKIDGFFWVFFNGFEVLILKIKIKSKKLY